MPLIETEIFNGKQGISLVRRLKKILITILQYKYYVTI